MSELEDAIWQTLKVPDKTDLQANKEKLNIACIADVLENTINLELL